MQRGKCFIGPGLYLRATGSDPKAQLNGIPANAQRPRRGVVFSVAERYREKNALEIASKCVWLAVAAIRERSAKQVIKELLRRFRFYQSIV